MARGDLRLFAHEIGNRLTPIRLRLAHLRRQQPEDGDLADVLAPVERELARIDYDLQSIMCFQACIDGTLAVQKRPTNLGALVQDMRALYDGYFSGLDVGFEVTPGADQVHIDAQRFTQVMHNLLSNAKKYTPRGGQVAVAVTGGPEVVVEVENSGPPLDPERARRLFGMFRQADATSYGLGIGLAVVQGIVLAHGGRLAVSTGKRWGGPCFRATFPADR